MLLNAQKYLPFLADADLTEEQKIAYITEVWNFLDAFFTHEMEKPATENSTHTGEFDLQSPAGFLDSNDLKTLFRRCANDNEVSEHKERTHG